MPSGRRFLYLLIYVLIVVLVPLFFIGHSNLHIFELHFKSHGIDLNLYKKIIQKERVVNTLNHVYNPSIRCILLLV
jgi:hypothetical protein